MKVSIGKLMKESGVGFGTSGARGLVVQMTDFVCYAYTKAFLLHCEKEHPSEKILAIAGDLRPSTGRILSAVACAAKGIGWNVIHCGRIPSPAIALYGIEKSLPTVMVTGSHIPEDRNGIKFNHPQGEITKKDEQGIVQQEIEVDETLFDKQGMLLIPEELSEVDCSAEESYVARYISFFGTTALHGLKLGVYEHSAVGRDILKRVLSALGAEVVSLGRSEIFVPVDTEAIRKEDSELAKEWAKNNYFALVSTDGDSDRPLLSDETGEWLRGDVLGILAANALGISSVATPVSCNTALEKSLLFKQVCRTRIGSPYVIEGMESLDDGKTHVAGYEANGGFLLQTTVEKNGKILNALPTRDALLPIISVLVHAKEQNTTISSLLSQLPKRFSASDRLKNFPTELSKKKILEIRERNLGEVLFGKFSGKLLEVNETDGYRMFFDTDEIIHLRPSGNAPELRCYVETASRERSSKLLSDCLQLLESFRGE